MKQVQNLYANCDLKSIWESCPIKYKESNNPCDHIIYNRWIERIPALLDAEIILVNNKNADAQVQWDLTNYDSDFDEDDIMNDPKPLDSSKLR